MFGFEYIISPLSRYVFQFRQFDAGRDLSFVLMPIGNIVRSLCIQLNSICNRKDTAKSLFGGACMKSKTVISMSCIPEWPGKLKCLPMSFVSSCLLMVPLCPSNLFDNGSPVWPTYCF